jgi:2-iminobutanoate/2-iminopropanoate deaminase
MNGLNASRLHGLEAKVDQSGFWLHNGVDLPAAVFYYEEGSPMQTILTADAPAPAGHYAQAIVHGGLVYVSGQLPIDPKTGEKRIGSIEEQTSQALENVAAILETAGSGLDQVIKTTVYVSDIGLWDRVNGVYAAYFGEHRPARAVVPTRQLHYGFQIEIEVVAVLDIT